MTAAHRTRFVAVAAITIVVDLLTKVWAENALAERSYELGFLTLRLVRNTGVAFSLGNDLPVAVVVAITGVLMAGFAVAGWRGHLGTPLIAGLLVGGGLGNLIDRALRGSVVDMFDVGAWPVFNVADIALTTGIGLMILMTFGEDDGEDQDEQAVGDPSGELVEADERDDAYGRAPS